MKRLSLAASATACALSLMSGTAAAQDIRIAHIYSKTGPLEAYEIGRAHV